MQVDEYFFGDGLLGDEALTPLDGPLDVLQIVDFNQGAPAKVLPFSHFLEHHLL